MFILDTNVLSSLRRPERENTNFRDWAENKLSDDSFLSAVTILEIEIGAARMARKDVAQALVFRQWIDKQVLPPFERKILPIDADIARRCAQLHVPDRRPERDAFIAATALTHGLTVVTRNVRDFVPMGVQTLNPWMASA
ncbi:MAG TPA: type II toxin-antitoxin system VapC family toxin [Rhizobiaceae bacterium]|nr:type II toxin-antitoxin system VapC family toxin [Rhizobiaceae bacterium]